MITVNLTPMETLDKLLHYFAMMNNNHLSMEAAMKGVAVTPETRLLVLHQAAAEASGSLDDCIIMEDWDPVTCDKVVIFSHDVLAMIVSSLYRGVRDITKQSQQDITTKLHTSARKHNALASRVAKVS